MRISLAVCRVHRDEGREWVQGRADRAANQNGNSAHVCDLRPLVLRTGQLHAASAERAASSVGEREREGISAAHSN